MALEDSTVLAGGGTCFAPALLHLMKDIGFETWHVVAFGERDMSAKGKDGPGRYSGVGQ